MDRALVGELPKRSTGADCKSAGTAFGGSNPPSPTTVFGPAAKTPELPAAFVTVFFRARAPARAGHGTARRRACQRPARPCCHKAVACADADGQLPLNPTRRTKNVARPPNKQPAVWRRARNRAKQETNPLMERSPPGIAPHQAGAPRTWREVDRFAGRMEPRGTRARTGRASVRSDRRTADAPGPHRPARHPAGRSAGTPAPGDPLPATGGDDQLTPDLRSAHRIPESAPEIPVRPVPAACGPAKAIGRSGGLHARAKSGKVDFPEPQQALEQYA